MPSEILSKTERRRSPSGGSVDIRYWLWTALALLSGADGFTGAVVTIKLALHRIKNPLSGDRINRGQELLFSAISPRLRPRPNENPSKHRKQQTDQ